MIYPSSSSKIPTVQVSCGHKLAINFQSKTLLSLQAQGLGDCAESPYHSCSATTICTAHKALHVVGPTRVYHYLLPPQSLSPQPNPQCSCSGCCMPQPCSVLGAHGLASCPGAQRKISSGSETTASQSLILPRPFLSCSLPSFGVTLAL